MSSSSPTATIYPKAVDPASFITVAPGASIKALQQNSYIALASPRILHQGNIQVNGAAAFVAAEAVALTINNGLFDIEVATGSSSALNTLVHEGKTGGPASTAAGDNHRIYMVAVPKNSAITALLSGSAGFDAAADAAIVNGEIVLSAGRNVVADAFVDPGPLPPSSFEIMSGTYDSSIRGSATLDFLAGTKSHLTVNGNLRLQGDAHAHLLANSTQSIVNGNLQLRSDNIIADMGLAGILDAKGGEAAILTSGDALVRVTGNALLSANAQGGFDGVAIVAGSGTGGTARISAAGGLVDIFGNLNLSANGQAGSGTMAPGVGASGVGGTATLAASTGGQISVGGPTQMSASGLSSRSDSADAGGLGSGGQLDVTADSGGLVTLKAALSATAQGLGGDNENFAGTGGAGMGGKVSIRATNGGAVDLQGGGFARSLGTGGSGSTGGAGTGGGAAIDATAGNVALGGGFELAANGQGGASSFLNAGRGGDGIGGTATVSAHSTDASSSITAGDLFVVAQGKGGAGGIGSGGVPSGGRGGDGLGGTASVTAEAASGTIASLLTNVQAPGIGGVGGNGGDNRDGGRGGDGTGGFAMAGTIQGASGPTVAGSAGLGLARIGAVGTGGAGGTGGDGLPTKGGSGGNGNGGRAELSSTGAPVTIPGGADVFVTGVGGAAGAGGAAAGSTSGILGKATGGRIVLGATRAAFAATPGSLTGGGVTGGANGLGDIATSVPGRFDVTADNGNIAFATLNLQTGTPGTPVLRPTSTVKAIDGFVDIAGLTLLTSGGNLDLDAVGTGRISGGQVQIAAPFGDISISHAGRNPASSTIQAQNFIASSLGSFEQAPGSRITAAGAGAINAGGDIVLGDASAGSAFSINIGRDHRHRRTGDRPEPAIGLEGHKHLRRRQPRQ